MFIGVEDAAVWGWLPADLAVERPPVGLVSREEVKVHKEVAVWNRVSAGSKPQVRRSEGKPQR